jgi:hypothetical protein
MKIFLNKIYLSSNIYPGDLISIQKAGNRSPSEILIPYFKEEPKDIIPFSSNLLYHKFFAEAHNESLSDVKSKFSLGETLFVIDKKKCLFIVEEEDGSTSPKRFEYFFAKVLTPSGIPLWMESSLDPSPNRAYFKVTKRKRNL